MGEAGSQAALIGVGVSGESGAHQDIFGGLADVAGEEWTPDCLWAF